MGLWTTKLQDFEKNIIASLYMDYEKPVLIPNGDIT